MFNKYVDKELMQRVKNLEDKVAMLEKPYQFEIGDIVICTIREYMSEPEEPFEGKIVQQNWKMGHRERCNYYQVLVDCKELKEVFEGYIEKKK